MLLQNTTAHVRLIDVITPKFALLLWCVKITHYMTEPFKLTYSWFFNSHIVARSRSESSSGWIASPFDLLQLLKEL